MKCSSLLFAVLCTFSLALAQDKFIEVAVNQSVELDAVQADAIIYVESVDYQRENSFNMMEEEFFYNDYYPDEMEYFGEDYEKQSAKERKRRDALYQEAVAEWEANYATMQEQMEQQRMDEYRTLPTYTVKNVMDTLQAAGIVYTIQNGGRISNPNWGTEFYADTQLRIITHSREEFAKLQSLFERYSVIHVHVDRIEYAKVESAYEEVLPKLTERANVQAEILAKSINKKLGNIQQITNVYPGFSSALLDSQLEASRRMYREIVDQDSDQNPFDFPKKSIIEFIFRYSILN